ncbi:MAG: hypothetical protein AAB250_07000, partial [Bdellovibrionota bacterium]
MQSIAAIDRISATTRYSKRQLLNGNSAFTTVSTVGASINNLRIRGVVFPGGADTQTFTVDVVDMAERGDL